MPTKDEAAQLLANAHFQLDQGITRIFRIVEADESNASRPVKLLEITPMTTEVGISPVGMTADPARGVYHSSVLIEISPDEFDRLQRGELTLPHGWQIREELVPPQPRREQPHELGAGICSTSRVRPGRARSAGG